MSASAAVSVCFFGVLASVMERASGQRFDQLMQAQMLAPLAMSTTVSLVESCPSTEIRSKLRLTVTLSSSSAVWSSSLASVSMKQSIVANEGWIIENGYESEISLDRGQPRPLFGEATERAFSAAIRRVARRAIMTTLVIFIVFAAVGFLLWMGGHDVLTGRISAGDLTAFVFYAVLVASSGAPSARPSATCSAPRARPSGCPN